MATDLLKEFTTQIYGFDNSFLRKWLPVHPSVPCFLAFSRAVQFFAAVNLFSSLWQQPANSPRKLQKPIPRLYTQFRVQFSRFLSLSLSLFSTLSFCPSLSSFGPCWTIRISPLCARSPFTRFSYVCFMLSCCFLALSFCSVFQVVLKQYNYGIDLACWPPLMGLIYSYLSKDAAVLFFFEQRASVCAHHVLWSQLQAKITKIEIGNVLL